MVNTFDRLKILYRLGFDKKQPKIFSFHDCLPEVFSHYIELLIYKRYRIIGVGELLERLLKSDIFHKEVLLTFDDGRRNCWSVIFPLLRKYKIKAVLFIIPSRIADVPRRYPNLEDYWHGKVSWENLYLSHRQQPYLTWMELEEMRSSGLIEIFSHSLKHHIVPATPSVVDFQHPGVYEIPVYFDEWIQRGCPELDSFWGAPVYERSWACLTSNVYIPDQKMNSCMNDFVKANGGFLFFRKKGWRKKLFQHYNLHSRFFSKGHFKKIETTEEIYESILLSKTLIEKKLDCVCNAFSLPLYQTTSEMMDVLGHCGYKMVFGGFMQKRLKRKGLYFFNRIPGFWTNFLAYF